MRPPRVRARRVARRSGIHRDQLLVVGRLGRARPRRRRPVAHVLGAHGGPLRPRRVGFKTRALSVTRSGSRRPNPTRRVLSTRSGSRRPNPTRRVLSPIRRMGLELGDRARRVARRPARPLFVRRGAGPRGVRVAALRSSGLQGGDVATAVRSPHPHSLPHGTFDFFRKVSPPRPCPARDAPDGPPASSPRFPPPNHGRPVGRVGVCVARAASGVAVLRRDDERARRDGRAWHRRGTVHARRGTIFSPLAPPPVDPRL